MVRPLTWRNVNINDGSSSAALGNTARGFGDSALQGFSIFSDQMNERVAREDELRTNAAIAAALQGGPRVSPDRRVDAALLQDSVSQADTDKSNLLTAAQQRDIGRETLISSRFTNKYAESDRDFEREIDSANLADTQARTKLEQQRIGLLIAEGKREEAAAAEAALQKANQRALENTFQTDLQSEVERLRNREAPIHRDSIGAQLRAEVQRMQASGTPEEEISRRVQELSANADTKLRAAQDAIHDEAFQNVIRKYARTPNLAEQHGLDPATFDGTSVGKFLGQLQQSALASAEEKRAIANERAQFEAEELDAARTGKASHGIIFDPQINDFRVANSAGERDANKWKITQFRSYAREEHNLDKDDISDAELNNIFYQLNGNASQLQKIFTGAFEDKFFGRSFNKKVVKEQAKTEAEAIKQWARERKAASLEVDDPLDLGTIRASLATDASNAAYKRDNPVTPEAAPADIPLTSADIMRALERNTALR